MPIILKPIYKDDREPKQEREAEPNVNANAKNSDDDKEESKDKGLLRSMESDSPESNTIKVEQLDGT